MFVIRTTETYVECLAPTWFNPCSCLVQACHVDDEGMLLA